MLLSERPDAMACWWARSNSIIFISLTLEHAILFNDRTMDSEWPIQPRQLGVMTLPSPLKVALFQKRINLGRGV